MVHLFYLFIGNLLKVRCNYLITWLVASWDHTLKKKDERPVVSWKIKGRETEEYLMGGTGLGKETAENPKTDLSLCIIVC